MPTFPRFPLFLNNGRKTNVELTTLTPACKVSEAELTKFTSFTLRIFKDLYNKTYEFDVAKMSYWLVPFEQSTQPADTESASFRIIDWNTLDYVCENPEGFQWTPDMSESFLVDKFFIDPGDGGRRFYSSRLAPEYKPSSPIPEGCAASKRQTDILDYSVSLWKNTRNKRRWNLDQPVLEAKKMLHRRNMLAEPTTKEEQDSSKVRSFICPEPLVISAVCVFRL